MIKNVNITHSLVKWFFLSSIWMPSDPKILVKLPRIKVMSGSLEEVALTVSFAILVSIWELRDAAYCIKVQKIT